MIHVSFRFIYRCLSARSTRLSRARMRRKVLRTWKETARAESASGRNPINHRSIRRFDPDAAVLGRNFPFRFPGTALPRYPSRVRRGIIARSNESRDANRYSAHARSLGTGLCNGRARESLSASEYERVWRAITRISDNSAAA